MEMGVGLANVTFPASQVTLKVLKEFKKSPSFAQI
jgi:hypothetical protein